MHNENAQLLSAMGSVTVFVDSLFIVGLIVCVFFCVNRSFT